MLITAWVIILTAVYLNIRKAFINQAYLLFSSIVVMIISKVLEPLSFLSGCMLERSFNIKRLQDLVFYQTSSPTLVRMEVFDCLLQLIIPFQHGKWTKKHWKSKTVKCK